MEHIFIELTLVICLAAVLSVFFRFLKQPAILAYILTGILVGPLSIFYIRNIEVMEALAQLGVTLLLFMLGLELRLSELKSVGKTALYTGIGQIVFTTVVGFGICQLLGFETLPSLYMAIALTFSSTIIIVKLLSDKKDLKSLYGKIAVGMMLVQDFVAVLALILLSGFNTSSADGISPLTIVLLLAKAVVLFGIVILLSKHLLPLVINKIARSGEVLFLFSLAWAFGIAGLVSSEYIGFSIEIGGFLAGLALANSTETYQIVARIRSLRDFFITIFFITLGMNMLFSHMSVILFPALVLAVYVLVGNPIIVMTILGLQGYRVRTSLLTGLTVAQISEFSLIVLFMGNKIGHVPDELVSLATLVGVTTFIASTYMILNGNKLYTVLSPFLGIFERSNPRDKKIDTGELKNHIVLVGANRMGESILEALLNGDDKVVVVDFDPDVVTRLQEKNITTFYGDISDPEIQEVVQLEKAKLVVSTVPDIDDNTRLLESLNRFNKKAKSIVFAIEAEDARELYKLGADYVVLPHLAGGRHLAKILVEKNHLELIERFKAKDAEYFR